MPTMYDRAMDILAQTEKKVRETEEMIQESRKLLEQFYNLNKNPKEEQS